jgi:hypothetical protein
MSAAPSPKSSTISFSSNKLSPGRLSRRGLFFTLAVILFAVATLIAYRQEPRPDPFSPTSTFDWFRYPIEQNAFRRLPYISSDLRSIFALKGTKQVWVIGARGLILHSSDGGKSWEQQKTSLPGERLEKATSLFSPYLLTSVWAQEPDKVSVEKQNSAPVTQTAPIQSQISPGQPPPAPTDFTINPGGVVQL